MSITLIRNIVLLLLALLALYVLAPFSIVPAGNRGVITTFGKPNEEIYGEGLHFRWPLVQRMHLVNVSIQKGEGVGSAASRDLQNVETKVAINYHTDPRRAVYVFRELGNEPGERIIVPSVHEAVKAVTANFTAEELIAKRADVRNQIVEHLQARMNRHGIVVDEFSIVDFQFSKTFNEAIEAKTTAEQLKMKADRDLERIVVEARQKVERAKAEAASLALQRQEVTPELLRLRETENQAKAIDKWDGHLPATMAGGAVPFLDLAALRAAK